MLTTRTHVLRYDFITHDHTAPKGSGYCVDQWTEQRLVRDWMLFGWRFWRQVIDVEVVPPHVLIARACMGGSDWQSKFKECIK